MKTYSEKQQQIIQVSMKLIIDEGMSKLTIRNIAKEIGVSEPAIYRHFTSKHEILIALIETLQSTIIPQFALISRSTVDPSEIFTPFLTALFTTIENNPAYALFVFSEEAFHNDPELRPSLFNLVTLILASIEKEFAQLENHVQWKHNLSLHDKATVTLSIIRFTVTKWHISHGKIKLTDEISPVSHLLHSLFF
jgi:AcrR family transcriptional regulator